MTGSAADPKLMRHALSLEWLRRTKADEARAWLLGVAGLGRKSVACVLLLALGIREFPVDVNVGRICARLGWIPLDAEQALEVRTRQHDIIMFSKTKVSLRITAVCALQDMDQYAPEPEVHKYLHNRCDRYYLSRASAPHSLPLLQYSDALWEHPCMCLPHAILNFHTSPCRLMRFDVEILYEIHYHMITLGKVSLCGFCCEAGA